MTTTLELSRILGLPPLGPVVTALVFQPADDYVERSWRSRQMMHDTVQELQTNLGDGYGERYLRVQTIEGDTRYVVLRINEDTPDDPNLMLKYPHDRDSSKLNQSMFCWEVRDILLPDGVLDYAWY